MRIAIFESISTPGGHEVDFDRILTEELTACGHEVSLCVPEDFVFKLNYGVPVCRLPGKAVSYTGVSGLQKLWRSWQKENHRQRWFSELYKKAVAGDFDAVIVPTSTYRYLRALRRNQLRHSPVPVLFILHGVNPGEAPKLFTQLQKLQDCAKIKAVALTFADKVFDASFPNLYCLTPPTYLPRDLAGQAEKQNLAKNLVLGFFGQYRREKQLDTFLDAFLQGKYTRPVKLLVQGSTMNPADSEDFERIIAKYQGHERIEFLHKGLIGKEWQTAISGIDVLLMPYSAPRYRYHWGGMLFTAIGYKKPVILSAEINPEVLAKYQLGMAYDSTQPGALQKVLMKFINTYDEMAATYNSELERAYQDYHPRAFAAKLAGLLQSI